MTPGHVLRLAFDLSRYQHNGWAIAYWASAAAILSVVALVAGGKGGQSREARRAFALNMSLVVAVVSSMGATLAAADAVHAKAVARLGIALGCFVGPATFTFACVLVGWRRQLRVPRIAGWASGVVLFWISLTTDWVMEGAWRTTWGYSGRAGFLAPLVLFHAFAFIAAALVVVEGRARATSNPEEKQQLRAVLAAYGVAQLIVLDLIDLWGVVIVPTGFIWMTGTAVILGHAMVQHQLLHVPAISSRTVLWALASLFSLVPVALFLVLTRDLEAWGRPMPTALMLLGLILFIRTCRAHVQPRIDALFRRPTRDFDGELERLAEKLLVLHTAEAIAREVAALLQRTLSTKLVALGVRDDDKWRIVHSAWGNLPPPHDDDPALRHLAATGDLFSREEAAGFPREPPFTNDGTRTPTPSYFSRPPEERLFVRLGAEWLLPLPAAMQSAGPVSLLGFMAVGSRSDGRPLDAVDLQFLRRLRAAVSAPLSAARLYDRRHGLWVELEQKVAARTADLERALAGLESAKSQLVQSEKMATLGLVVSGVASEIESAVDVVGANVPKLAEAVRAYDQAVVEALASIPLHRREEAQQWTGEAELDFMRKDIGPLTFAIAEGARRASTIAGDLGRFARADREKRELVDLHREIDATLNLLRHELKDRIRMELALAENLPLVDCHRGPIGQVFMNLILNAAQSIEGRGTIGLRTRALDGGTRVEVMVRDTGKGIPEKHLGRIFEPFFTTKAPGGRGGTGLGLSVTYGIVQRHGGRIDVSSRVGEGTEFRVILPVAWRRSGTLRTYRPTSA
ncbi:MAG: hypothetical protein HY698_03225 [Deltaproteobacteria bacterium]|nr:hypothetical protein [Deltaproteobacteria bacterium]